MTSDWRAENAQAEHRILGIVDISPAPMAAISAINAATGNGLHESTVRAALWALIDQRKLLVGDHWRLSIPGRVYNPKLSGIVALRPEDV